jgi:hypothetical protein
MRYKPFNKKEENKVKELVKAGRNIKEISEEMGRGYNYMRTYLIEKGLNYASSPYFKKISPERIQAVLHAREILKFSINDIQKVYHMGRKTVLDIFDEYGIVYEGRGKRSAEYIDVDGEKVCTGMSYIDYLKKAYGSNYKKYLKDRYI